MNRIKQLILRTIEARGYVLLKRGDYNRMSGTGAQKDDGSLQFAKAAGMYMEGVEAPIFPERAVEVPVVQGPRTTVIFTFGQSNAANSGQGVYSARHPIYVFNVFDMGFYKAIDPLPGASNDGAAVWGRLGDMLVDAGIYDKVIFVPIAVGGSFIREWSSAQYRGRLLFALNRIRMARIKIDRICWHQGEAEANHTDMSAEEYRRHFRSIIATIRKKGFFAPVLIAIATRCESADHPFKNNAQIRQGQMDSTSWLWRIWPGPDTDQIGISHRYDRCHFASSGIDLHARAWFEALTGRRTHAQTSPGARAP